LLRDAGCDLPLEKLRRCARWDASFQDAHYFEIGWGKPRKNLCMAQIQNHRKKIKKDQLCPWDTPQLWKWEKCSNFGVDKKFSCYTCNRRHSGDESLHRLQAYSADCRDAILIETAGISLKNVMRDLATEESLERQQLR
jgi:hypothetical protein